MHIFFHISEYYLSLNFLIDIFTYFSFTNHICDANIRFIFFIGRTTKVLPSLHQWLSGPCQIKNQFYSPSDKGSVESYFNFFPMSCV